MDDNGKAPPHLADRPPASHGSGVTLWCALNSHRPPHLVDRPPVSPSGSGVTLGCARIPPRMASSSAISSSGAAPSVATTSLRSRASLGGSHMTTHAATPAAAPKFKAVYQECALLLDDDSVPLAGRSCNIPTPTQIGLYFVAAEPLNASAWVGFSLKVPFGHPGQVDNENDGFGVSGTCKLLLLHYNYAKTTNSCSRRWRHG
jgi:hypothetical protein